MTESLDTDPADDTPGTVLTTPDAHRPSAPGGRWVVPSLLAVGLVVAVLLIVTGRGSDDTAGPLPTTTATPAGQPLPWLGTLPDNDALLRALRGRDTRTLSPRTTPPDTASPASPPASTSEPVPADAPTSRDAQRCDRGITKTSTDPLGAPTAAIGANLAGSPVLVTTYEVLASVDHPAGLRIFVVDPRSCRVLTAIDQPD